MTRGGTIHFHLPLRNRTIGRPVSVSVRRRGGVERLPLVEPEHGISLFVSPCWWGVWWVLGGRRRYGRAGSSARSLRA